jgi:hypothetical protein
MEIRRALNETDQKTGHGEDDEYEEHNLGDPDGTRRDSTEAEQCGDQCDD